MATSSRIAVLDRYAEITDLATSVRRLIGKAIVPLGIVLAIESAILWFSGHPGATCFVLVSMGCLLVLNVWRHAGIGLPVVPLMALQNLLAYALPLVVRNETVMGYSPEHMNEAGIEVLVFSVSLAIFWRFGMQAISVSSRLCFALQGFEDEKMTELSRLGFRLAIGASVYALLRSIGLLDSLLEMLPAGSYSIVNALVSGVSACGFFLSSMMLGKGVMPVTQRVAFWLMLFVNCYISASAFLLSSTAMIIFSVLIGLFWSTGRIPWKFVAIFISILSFLNLGKFEMREKYWRHGDDDQVPQITFGDMPHYYQEWTAASFATLTGNSEMDELAAKRASLKAHGVEPTGQSMLDRVNNLQNLLYVIQMVRVHHVSVLGGDTYTLIPPLLIPRIIWPDKPRSHEGQILLNVHFGRQDLNSTFQTYIAWGLQAEAYGNFGPLTGNFLLGIGVGLFFAWIEKYIAHKLVLSMEGFLAFTLFVAMANSFEMVASVLVTSIFQSFIPVIVACRPFVHRIVPRRQEHPA